MWRTVRRQHYHLAANQQVRLGSQRSFRERRPSAGSVAPIDQRRGCRARHSDARGQLSLRWAGHHRRARARERGRRAEVRHTRREPRVSCHHSDPIVAGRAFEARDEQRGAACSFLVSDSIARRSRKGRDPLGRRMSFGEALGDWPMVVVGVVGEVRYSGLETCPTVDVNLPQGLFPQSAITLIARRGAVSAGAHSRRGPACFRDGHTLHGSTDRRVVSPAPCEHALCFGVRLDSPSLGRGRRL